MTVGGPAGANCFIRLDNASETHPSTPIITTLSCVEQRRWKFLNVLCWRSCRWISIIHEYSGPVCFEGSVHCSGWKHVLLWCRWQAPLPLWRGLGESGAWACTDVMRWFGIYKCDAFSHFVPGRSTVWDTSSLWSSHQAIGMTARLKSLWSSHQTLKDLADWEMLLQKRPL